MKYSLLIICFGLFTWCYGQEHYHFQIVNAEDGTPVPYATIIFKTTQSGFGSNQNGEFRLDMQTVNPNETIQITSIGYTTFESTIRSLLDIPDKKIRLQPSVIMLAEIQVQAERESPEGMVRKASKHLGKNMSKKPYYVTGLYNEHITMDNESLGYTDAYGIVYVTAYDPAFNRRNEMFGNDLAQWKEIRRITYQISDHCDTSRNKTLAMEELLAVKKKFMYDGPLTSGNLDGFQYNYDSVTTYNGRDVFVVHFISNEARMEGQIYITADDYAVIRLTATGNDFSTIDDCFGEDPYSFEIEFSFVQDKYQLKYMALDHFYQAEKQIHEHVELTTGEFANQDALPLNLDQRTILFNEMNNPFITYNPSFWEETGIAYDSGLNTTFGGKKEVMEQFKLNADHRIIPLPDNMNSYEALYQDQQLFLLFVNDDF